MDDQNTAAAPRSAFLFDVGELHIIIDAQHVDTVVYANELESQASKQGNTLDLYERFEETEPDQSLLTNRRAIQLVPKDDSDTQTRTLLIGHNLRLEHIAFGQALPFSVWFEDFCHAEGFRALLDYDEQFWIILEPNALFLPSI